MKNSKMQNNNKGEEKIRRFLSDNLHTDSMCATKKKRHPFFIYILGFIFLYALFALDRIKNTLSFTIEKHSTTNEIWIIPLLLCLICISKPKNYLKINKSNLVFTTYLFMFLLIITIGAFSSTSIIQFLYAGLLFFIPIFLFFAMSKCNLEQIIAFMKFFIVICLIYALFAIILVYHYAFFNNLIGNSVDNYRYYSQIRPSMMLGSSITVSYYFNLTLPLCIYMYFTSKERKWKFISALTIISITIATLVLLSRLATLITGLIIVYSLLFTRQRKKSKSRKIGVIIFIIIAMIYAFRNYKLSRITNGFNFSGSGETSERLRLQSAKLGLHIFESNPLFGSGMGTYYKRVYDNRFITVDDLHGLIDPHNMYILILSEMGVIGFLIFVLFFSTLFKRFSNISERNLRHTAYLTLFVFLFDAIGGSHLFNEISFATIFWMYIGLFNAVSIRDRSITFSKKKVVI